MQPRAPADLDVLHQIGGLRFDELGRDPLERIGVLHEPNREIEGPEELGLVGADRRRDERGAHPGHGLRRVDAAGPGELDRGVDSNGAIEVEMELRLRHSQDEWLNRGGHDAMLRSGRMSSPATTRMAPGLGSAVNILFWIVLAAAVALGAAGLTGQLTHPPGGPSREELTYPGDHALAARLDDATARLTDVAANVDTMATAAKAALGAIAVADATSLKTNLERGNGAAVLISSATLDLRSSLAGLPGDGPDARIQFSNATLVRRAQILAAIDAALSLSEQWQNVTGRSVDAARVVTLMQQHDTTIFAATALGRTSNYTDAIAQIEQARISVADVASLRDQLVTSGDLTVLDEWVERNNNYDVALESLYKGLIASHGRNTLLVQAFYRDEKIAREQLPNPGAITVIVAEIARGGLNQAVLAIDDARRRIDEALGVPA